MRRAWLTKVMYTSILTAVVLLVALLVYLSLRPLTRESIVEFTSLLSALAGILIYTYIAEWGDHHEDH